MPRFSDLYPSKYLTHADLDDEGWTVTIRSIEVEKMRDGTEKPIVYFDETPKGLACNKTNAKTISKLYGEDTDDWEGEKITIYPTECDFGGEVTPCIRVRAKKPKPAAKTAGNGAKAPDGGKKNKVMTQADVDDDGDNEDSPPF